MLIRFRLLAPVAFAVRGAPAFVCAQGTQMQIAALNKASTLPPPERLRLDVGELKRTRGVNERAVFEGKPE
ncbi:MAG: hypothetical protein WBD67_13400 [Terracidiphilus sp.]